MDKTLQHREENDARHCFPSLKAGDETAGYIVMPGHSTETYCVQHWDARRGPQESEWCECSDFQVETTSKPSHATTSQKVDIQGFIAQLSSSNLIFEKFEMFTIPKSLTWRPNPFVPQPPLPRAAHPLAIFAPPGDEWPGGHSVAK